MSDTLPNGMKRLQFMCGNWHIKAHSIGENGEWQHTPLPNETRITSIFNGSFHREIMPVTLDGITVNLFFSWSYDKFRNIYRMISCSDADGLMSILEGNFKEGSNEIVISDINTGTAVLDTNSKTTFFRRLTSTKTSQDSFTDIVSESYDNGLSWDPIFQAIHTRK